MIESGVARCESLEYRSRSARVPLRTVLFHHKIAEQSLVWLKSSQSPVVRGGGGDDIRTKCIIDVFVPTDIHGSHWSVELDPR